jgi:SNF2 family DNA or RNA helicase
MFRPLKGMWTPEDVVHLSLRDNGKFVMDCYSLYENFRYGPGGVPLQKVRGKNKFVVELHKRFPECNSLLKNEDATGLYEPVSLSATDITCELIAALVPEENLRFEDDYTESQFRQILVQSHLYDQIAELIAAYKCDKYVPPHEYEMCLDKTLALYQQLALVCQQCLPGFGLFMEQGTGKTPVVIAAICNAAKRHREAYLQRKAESEAAGIPFTEIYSLYTAIIVCPNNLRLNWENEFYTFSTQPGRLTTLRGTGVDRVKQLCDVIAPDPDDQLVFSVVITGYQTLYRSWESIQFIPWNFAALDEGQAIKNEKAKQTKACLKLGRTAQQRVILTGTPIANSMLDLYTMLEFMVEGGSGFSSWKEFKKFYGVFDRAESGHDIQVGTQNVTFLQERLARMSYFITKKEALPDLPEKVYDIIEVEMGDHQRDCYNKLADQLALEIEATLANDTMQRSMLISCILTKLLRLAQVTSGFICWDAVYDIESGDLEQPKQYEYFFPNPKVDAVMELLAEKGPNDKTIIWACWIPDIDYLEHACKEHGIDCVTFRGLHKGYTDEMRMESVRRFNEDPNCKVFIATQASGGAGLNLLGYPPGAPDGYETNCNHEIFVSQGWSNIHRQQAEDRANRRGTRVTTRITDIVVPRSIDQEIRARVTSKKDHAVQVTDLGEIMRKINKVEAE